MNVDSSQWAAAFDDPECFFTQELGTAIHYVETLAGSARKARETGASESHEAGPIAVFGRRGAGKSSFLKALAKKLEAAHPEDGRILCLEVLEPNRIEKHEVFLATVVALILQKLDSVKPDSFRGPHASKDSEGALGKVRDALQDLTSYFNVLVPKESLSKRDPNESSISFAQRVLADSRAGLRLPKAFHRFLNAAAEVLRTDAILLMIDDTDVAHDRCVDVLETVRKYLCTPRLITVVAADLELLELQIARDSVRWGTELQELEALFGETASNLEGAVTKRHRAQAYALQEQYLSKVLPEHRRVRIPSVARKLREGAVRLLLTKGDQETQLVVCRESAKDSKVDALQEFCTVLGIPRIDAVEYLPVGSRSLARLCRTLYYAHPKTPPSAGNGASKPGPGELLDELAAQLRTARHALGVRHRMLYALREGGGDMALSEWVIRQSVGTPRSFLLCRDPVGDGDGRRLIPALVHGYWLAGCRERRRADAFLSYGLKVVLPAYQVECTLGDRAEREKTAEELLYRLKIGENQDCASIVGRLLAWQHRLKPANASSQNAGLATIGSEVPGSPSRWYEQIEGRNPSFFMGLARVADLCAMWPVDEQVRSAATTKKLKKSKKKATNSEDGANADPQLVAANADLKKLRDQIQQRKAPARLYVTEIGERPPESDAWEKWLNLFAKLHELDEDRAVLPARVVGEVFVFLHNLSTEEVLWAAPSNDPAARGGYSAASGGDTAKGAAGKPGQTRAQQTQPPAPNAYVHALWYAVITHEHAWRSDQLAPTRPGGLYRKVTEGDVSSALKNAGTQKSVDHVLWHSLIWLACPLFEAARSQAVSKDIGGYLSNVENNPKSERAKPLVNSLRAILKLDPQTAPSAANGSSTPES